MAQIERADVSNNPTTIHWPANIQITFCGDESWLAFCVSYGQFFDDPFQFAWFPLNNSNQRETSSNFGPSIVIDLQSRQQVKMGGRNVKRPILWELASHKKPPRPRF